MQAHDSLLPDGRSKLHLYANSNPPSGKKLRSCKLPCRILTVARSAVISAAGRPQFPLPSQRIISLVTPLPRFHRPLSSRLLKKPWHMSFRAERGICFSQNPKEKADSSGTKRPRNDKWRHFSATC